ncbi:fumarylacetoacetate hydrolase family protein [Glaciecola siphonariae]|uniref:Fumarylacetoacetate hydrolase family protein n=1 Tax=Glaciecola siphonariae TaxID=521012 RepID=A0ABV9LRI8_9ALTE
MNCVNFKNTAIQPSKVICIGRNYAAHIAELSNDVPSEPVIFIKPNSAISAELNTHAQDDIHFETELCFLIENNQFAGIGLGLDLTKRAVQDKLKEKGLPWERAKAFDHSALFTDFVSLPDSLTNLHFTLHINEQLTQQGSYELMLHKPQNVLKEIHSFMSTENGDIIMTGTPKGVGFVHSGDVFKVALYGGRQLLIEHQWIVN